MKMPVILYEDNHLIAVFKPHRMLVQSDSTGDQTLMDWTRDWLRNKYKKPGNVFLGLIHRLDRPVAGIVLFGKTSKGASRISEQVRNHRVVKLYIAKVQGETAKKGHLVHFLDSQSDSQTKAFAEDGNARKRAELEFKCLQTDGKTSLIEIHLITGRKHQIRAQFAFIKHPIVGDKKYGSTIPFEHGAIALINKMFEFFHPVDLERKIKIELPSGYYEF